MLVQRDKNILRFIENHGGITIRQCANIFFNDSKHSYDLARKRLKKMYEMGLVKYITNTVTNERVYCTHTKLSPHSLYLLDVYSIFVANNCKILEFKKERKWLNGKRKSDGFFKIEYNSKKRIYCVEIDINNATHIEKYEEIYESGEIQNEYGGFPMVIIVGKILDEEKSDNFDVVYLDYKLTGFVEKVLAL